MTEDHVSATSLEGLCRRVAALERSKASTEPLGAAAWSCPKCRTDRRHPGRKCCNSECGGHWGTGCYCCHHQDFLKAEPEPTGPVDNTEYFKAIAVIRASVPPEEWAKVPTYPHNAAPEPEPEVVLEWEWPDMDEGAHRLHANGLIEYQHKGGWHEATSYPGLANAISELRKERAALKVMANAAEGTMHKAIDRAQAAESHVESLEKALHRARRYVEKAESERDDALARLAAIDADPMTG